jgi:hypothetical protein
LVMFSVACRACCMRVVLRHTLGFTLQRRYWNGNSWRGGGPLIVPGWRWCPTAAFTNVMVGA